MQSCCLEGCESYKYISKQKIGYFKFPLNDKSLFQKWLNQIRKPNWCPSEVHQICSTHFHVDDIDFSHKQPKLKENAIPMILPLKHFQNIYIDKINNDPAQEVSTKLNKYETQQIIMNNPTTILYSPPKSSSMVLLCTPTQESNNISNLQISSLPTSNISMKKIPIKNDLNNSNSKSPELSALNPYVLIISDKKDAQIPFKNESLKKTRAILKIQIDKKINTFSSNDSILHSLVEKNKCNQINEIDIKSSFKTSYMEEVEIDDISSSKIVIFKFDSSTGKITVFKKEKLMQNIEISRQKFDSKKSISINNFKYLNKNLKENISKIQENSNQLTNQEKLKSCKENIKIFNNPSVVVTNPCSKRNNLNINMEKVNELNITIKNIKKVMEKEDPEIEKNEIIKNQLNNWVKKSTELLRINQNINCDFCSIKNDVQKRKFDIISTTNLKKDEYQEISKNLKKIKKDLKK